MRFLIMDAAVTIAPKFCSLLNQTACRTRPFPFLRVLSEPIRADHRRRCKALLARCWISARGETLRSMNLLHASYSFRVGMGLGRALLNHDAYFSRRR